MKARLFVFLLGAGLLSGLAAQDHKIDIYYHIEAEFKLDEGGRSPKVAGTNHIKIINKGKKELSRIYIRNSSNKYFDPNNPLSPKTLLGKIESQNINQQPVWSQTVMPIELSPALSPGKETTLHVPFETVISPQKARAYSSYGSKNDTTIFMLRAFYPRLEYLYPDGWRPTEYKTSEEEHHPSSDFLVELIIPSSMKIASSGVLLNEEKLQAKTLYRYVQNDSREFATLVSEYFDSDVIRVPGMAVKIMMPPGQLKKFGPMKKMVADVLGYYKISFGQSPSPEMTITTSYSLGNDMSSLPNLFVVSPEFMRNKGALAHELAHQWFGGSGAFELQDDMWFTEAVAEYASSSYFRSNKEDKVLFNSKKPYEISLGDIGEAMSEKSFIEWVQLAYEISGDNSLPPFYEAEKKKWEQETNKYSVYAVGSYTLQMLKETIGKDKINLALSSLVSTESKTPISALNFLNILEYNFGSEVSRQYALALTTAAKADIIIKDQISKPTSKTAYKNIVVFDRKGAWLLPVDVLAILETGDSLFFRKVRYATQDTLSFISKSAVKKVEIDPENRVYDSNRYNNRWPRTISPQPLTEIPSWKVYSVYFRPRALRGWDGGQRVGVRYSGRVGINLMPYQSALYQHSFDLDVLFATSRPEKNWSWFINYRTPVKSTDLMFWRFTAGYDFPRNTQGLSFIFYIGKPKYWATDGRSSYKRLTTNVSRLEYLSSDSLSWWRKSQSWTVKEQLVLFNYTGKARSIFRTSAVSGVYVFSGDKYRIHKLSTSYDHERHLDVGLIARAHVDLGVSYGSYPDNSFKFRIKQVAGGWKSRESYIPLFRGSIEIDEVWQSSVLSTGFSLGLETNWYVWPMIYTDMVVTSGDAPHNDIKEQIDRLMVADPLYMAAGFGVESQSIIELGAYFPVWVSHPSLGESSVAFRFFLQAGFYF